MSNYLASAQLQQQRTVIKKQLNELRPTSNPSATQQQEGAKKRQLIENLINAQAATVPQDLGGSLPVQQRTLQQKPSAIHQSGLASEKHFTTQELQKLHLRTNGANPVAAKKIVKEELKKTGSKMSFTQGGYQKVDKDSLLMLEAGYNMSQTSKGMMSLEQQERLKNFTRRPFSVKSNTSRPGTASSQNQQTATPEALNEFQMEDDAYEEISIPDVDYEERMKLMKMLDQREKDREELELESAFADLKKQANLVNEEELDTLTSVSVQEMKEMKEERKQVNIYKPTLKKPGDTLRQPQPQQKQPSPFAIMMNQKQFYPNMQPSQSQSSVDDSMSEQSRIDLPTPVKTYQYKNALVPLPSGNDGNARLDHIYAQIRELQQFKDEIKDDLDEFLDEVDMKSIITNQDQFDDVVDIIANEQRERGELIVDYQEKGMADEQLSEAASEVLDENGKPFWMKFFKADYLEDSDPVQQQPTQAETKTGAMGAKGKQINVPKQIKGKKLTPEEQEKVRSELEKVRKLDAMLAQKTKFQRDLKYALLEKEQEKRELEEEHKRMKLLAQKQQQQQQSKISDNSKTGGKKPTKPPSAANTKQRGMTGEKGKKPKDDLEDEDAGDTFLTDMLNKKRSGSQASTKKRAAKINEEEDEDDSEEQDVVYDYDQMQYILEEADDFLHQPILTLPAPGDDNRSPSKQDKHNQSQTSFKSNMTGMTTGSKNFMALNKERARDYNPFRPVMKCDGLDEESKSRLMRLTEEIDGDLDNYMKKKDEFYAIEMEKSEYGPIADPDNAYLYTKDDVNKIEQINESLRKVAPMLPMIEDEFQPSGQKSKLGLDPLRKDYDHSKMIAGASNFDDKMSMRSVPMSTATRKSNLTMLTHNTFKSGMGALPRERKLREIAEQRMLQGQLRDIDNNLKRIQQSDDLSYAPSAIENSQPLSDSKGFAVALQKKAIDSDILSRLIEEAREEEERFSIMYDPLDGDGGENGRQMVVHAAGQKERTMRELAKIEEQSHRFDEASMMFNDIEKTKDRYLEVLDTVHEREKSILTLEKKVNKLFKESETQASKLDEKANLKRRLLECEKEMKDAISDLEYKEKYFEQIRDKENAFSHQMEEQLSAQQHPSTRFTSSQVEEAEEDDRLSKIMRDIESFNQIQAELDESERQLTDHNTEILAAVHAHQEGRDDNTNELMEFTKRQIELYKSEQEGGAAATQQQ